MRLLNFATISVLMFSMVLGFQNCAGPGSTSATSTTDSISDSQIDLLKNTIQSTSTQDLSCTQDSDCTLISQPMMTGCGPQGYWVTSINNPEVSKLQQLANQLGQEIENMASQNGMVFSCEEILPPTPSCNQNVCTASYPNMASN